MTITARLNADGIDLEDNTDKVAAFVGNDLRGVGSPTVFVTSTGEFVVFLRVYSNSASGEDIRFEMYDASEDNQVAAINTIPFQNNATVGTNTSPVLITNNNVPTDIILSSTRIDENESANTQVGLFSTTDDDAGETFTYALVAGEGSANNDDFLISNNELLSNTIFNYEVKSTYSIRVKVTDSKGGVFEKAFTIQVNDVNDPPFSLGLSNSNLEENSVLGTVVGILSSGDIDVVDNHTYTFVAGTGDADNASFTISGSDLKINTAVNFEQKNTYSVRVRTTDSGGGFFEEDFTINILDVNEAPSQLSLSNSQVPENSPFLTEVGQLSTTDQDANESHTYSFVGEDNDNASFVLDGNILKVFDETNFEEKPVFVIKIRTEDKDGAILDRQFTINIVDANDAPTAMQLSELTIDENQAAGTVVGIFTTSDQDLNDNHAYALVAGIGSDDNAAFDIPNAEDRLVAEGVLDFETKSRYKIRVRSDDGNGGSIERAYVILVNDTNDDPTALRITNNQILETAPIGSAIGRFITTDEDNGDIHAYALVSGEGDVDNNAFIIVDGELFNTNMLDFETQESYQIRVRTTDTGGGSFEEQFTINIIDANDVPDKINLSNNSLNENDETIPAIGTLSTVDADAGESFTYIIDQVFDNEFFFIEGNTLKPVKALDFEEQIFYTLQITSIDKDNASVTQQFVIQVLDQNDAPSDITLDNLSIAENLDAGALVAEITTSDQDVGDEHTYVLIEDVADNDAFLIENNQLKTAVTLDFETQESYKIKIQVEDSDDGIFEKSFVILVEDQNDGPTGILLSNNRIDENKAKGTLVGKLIVEDIDGDDRGYVYSFTGDGFDNDHFELDGNQLLSSTVFNYEAEANYEILVRATDVTGAFIQDTFKINVIDANDVPESVSLSNAALDENLPSSTTIGIFTTSDQDLDDQFVYEIETGLDADMFVIEDDQLRTNTSFDFEAKKFYSIKVSSTDLAGGRAEATFVIEINDANDAPFDLTLNGNTIAENAQERVKIGLFTAQDQDAGDSHTYTLTEGFGDDGNGYFIIENGELLSGATFNFEEQSDFSIRVQVADDNGGQSEQIFQINVLDRNDTPSDIEIEIPKFNENQPIGTFVTSFSTVDEDPNDAFTYTLAPGEGDNDNNRFRISNNVLITDDLFDAEETGQVSIRIRSKDDNAFTEKVFLLSVESVNEAPILEDITFRVIEETPVGTLVGQLEAFDQDFGQSITYTILYGEPVDERQVPFDLDPVSGEIRVNNNLPLDYEQYPVFNLFVEAKDDGLGQLSDTAQVTIRLEDVMERELPANNFISPNGDGYNDVFFIQNVQIYSDYTLLIMDQFGNVVYKRKPYINDWDGTSDSGKALPSGVYYYKMSSEFEPYVYQGSITLIRE